MGIDVSKSQPGGWLDLELMNKFKKKLVKKEGSRAAGGGRQWML